ncbi:MAG: SMP-30/gluconolactonase/LRE family protein [Verrucomicrobiota bacterium]
MRPTTNLLFLLLLGITLPNALGQQKKPIEDYPVPPEAVEKESTPKGRMKDGTFTSPEIFPGTVRDYTIYIPHAHDGSTPACLMVFQDGHKVVRSPLGKRMPIVLDNMIQDGELPPIIGVFVNPGVVPPAEGGAERWNRSFEYDSVGDRYARFLIEELLPHVQEQHGVNISEDPDDRGIGGASSGAICAFNAAWYRPDSFRRVLSTIGTYVGLRGGDEFPTLVRKTEPKPLRVFLQDGENDLNIYGGDWWMANQTMQRALEFSGYEVKHIWGKGGHNRKHEAAIFPEAMRWLWEDHGKTPVTTHYDRCKSRASQYLIDGEGWEVVSEGHEWAEGLACTPDGTLYFSDVPAAEIYKVTPDGEKTLVVADSGKANGLALGPDGKLYGCSNGWKQIVAWDTSTWEPEVIAENVTCNDLVVAHNGDIYFTSPLEKKIHFIDGKTRKLRVVDRFERPNGITLSPDQTHLFVAHFLGRFIYSYRIADNGSLQYKQPYFYLHDHPTEMMTSNDGMCTTVTGELLVGTWNGIQICDQAGRVQLILPRPDKDADRTNYAAFGGPDGKTLYTATRGRVWKRKVQLQGAHAWQAPITPPKPKL